MVSESFHVWLLTRTTIGRKERWWENRMRSSDRAIIEKMKSIMPMFESGVLDLS